MADRRDDDDRAAKRPFTDTSRRGWSLRRRVRERGSYGVLFGLIVLLLTATALAAHWPASAAIVAILEGIVLLYALWSARAGRRVLRLALVVVPVVVVVIAAAAGRTSDVADAAVAAAEAALSLGAIAAIVRELTEHLRISRATILGALCVYLLIGLLFASVYTTVSAVSPDSFFAQQADPSAIDFLYFSFVTLSTVGYGDLTAAGNLGRMLAVTEALLGQLYLVTVVALIIGNVGRERSPR